MSSANTEYYKYHPSLAAAAAFVALFAISTILHTYQLFRTRTWYMIPVVLGGFCEWIGYVGRAINAREAPGYHLAPFLIQAVLLLIAAVLFAASIYMELGHVILLIGGDHHSVIRKKLLTPLFVCGDVFSFLVQSSGAGMLAKKDPDSKAAGKWIVIGGLALQLIFFGLFMIFSFIFHSRVNRTPTPRSLQPEIPWRKHMYVLYATSVLIMIRSVFRAVEYAEGDNGYLLRNELWLYIFDATLMWCVMVLLNAVHPSEVNALLKGGKGLKAIVQVKTLEKVVPDDEGKMARHLSSIGPEVVC